MTGFPARAAAPVLGHILPVTSVSAFAVDNAHNHLLVGSGATSSGLLVTDLMGNTVTTVATGTVDDISIGG